MSTLQQQSVLRCICCEEGGGGGPTTGTCQCNCPCSSPGGQVGCGGRKIYPVDVSISVSGTSASVEAWVAAGAGGTTRLYSNLDDINAWIGESDPAAVTHKQQGMLLKFIATSSLSGGAYDLTDDTSSGCEISGLGMLVRYKATNGDTYEFDAMAGMPKLDVSREAVQVVRRSGCDFAGIDTVSGDDIEFHLGEDYEMIDDADTNATWTTQVSRNSSGEVGFDTTYLPHKGIRATYTDTRINTTDNTHTITNGLATIAAASTGFTAPRGTGLSGETAITDRGNVGTGVPATKYCVDGVENTAATKSLVGYTFNPAWRSTTPGSFVTTTRFFASAVYQRDSTQFCNMTSGITGTAVSGSRGNAGCYSCGHCLHIQVMRTEPGGTPFVEVEGDLRQAAGAPIAPGADPRGFGWMSTCSWSGTGMNLTRVGPQLWKLTAGPITRFFKGSDCPSSITEGLALVNEAQFTTTTGAGTLDDPQITTTQTRLDITTIELVITSGTCDPAWPDPCSPGEWESIEEGGGEGGEGMMMMAARAAPTPAYAPTAPDQEDVVICEWKLARDWTDEGQAILRAGILLEQGTKVVISAAAWNAALEHLR